MMCPRNRVNSKLAIAQVLGHHVAVALLGRGGGIAAGLWALVQKIRDQAHAINVVTIRIVQTKLIAEIGPLGPQLEQIHPLHTLHRLVNEFTRGLAALFPHGDGFGLALFVDASGGGNGSACAERHHGRTQQGQLEGVRSESWAKAVR